MKIGVVGAGAVGSFFGAMLEQAGNEVTFLARGRHLAAMKENGLTVNRENSTMNVYGNFTDELEELADSELILFCVKSHDTEQMAKELLPLISKDAKLITMQNGVDNEETLKNIFGSSRTFSCATYIQSAITEPGTVQQQGRVALVVGELVPHARDHCAGIVDIFQQAGINTKHTSNILDKKWRKFLWNITFNPLSAIANAGIGDIIDHDTLRQTAEKICREAMEVALLQGININREEMLDTIFKNAERARGHHTSMLQDRINNKQMEVESMCGYVLRKAKEYDVPAPVIETLYNILTYMNEQLTADTPNVNI
ncbi:ketopantoate reductase family protein [Virgibacillus kimchii]